MRQRQITLQAGPRLEVSLLQRSLGGMERQRGLPQKHREDMGRLLGEARAGDD